MIQNSFTNTNSQAMWSGDHNPRHATCVSEGQLTASTEGQFRASPTHIWWDVPPADAQTQLAVTDRVDTRREHKNLHSPPSPPCLAAAAPSELGPRGPQPSHFSSAAKIGEIKRFFRFIWWNQSHQTKAKQLCRRRYVHTVKSSVQSNSNITFLKVIQAAEL